MNQMDWIALILILIGSFLGTFFLTMFLSKFFLKKGIYGLDVHKANKPKVAEMGGIGIFIILIIAIICCIFIYDEYWQHFTIALITILIVGAIGIWDDIKTLGPITKPFLLLIPSLPIIIWQLIANHTFSSDGLILFHPNPFLPLIGSVRITIIYWLLIPFAITVLSNATNMLDVLNGSTPITVMLLSAVGIISTVTFHLKGVITLPGMVLSVLLFGCMFAFFWFNKYPAKIFCGDTGSLTIGAVLALIAIFGRIEIVLIVAMMPHIMNSFQIIYSIKGLKERHQIKERPTKVLPNEFISANPNEKAPLTFTRWLVAKQPLKEYEVVLAIAIVTTLSSILAIITMVLIYITL